MTAPANSFATNFGRFYRHPSAGVDQDPNAPYAPKPSVTNIIGMISKDFLPPYYAKLVATYAVENLSTLQYQVDRFGPEVAIGSLKAIPNRPNVNAAIGDEVHNAIDEFCKGTEERPEFSTHTAANMYAQWLHFYMEYRPRIIRSEFTVWSYRHGFAGTGDLLVETDEGLGIWDTKTGNRLYPEVALQTVALAHADVILDEFGNESPMPRIDFFGGLHIRPRSAKLYELQRTEEAWETFMAAKRIFDWKRFDADQVLSIEPFKSEWKKGSE